MLLWLKLRLQPGQIRDDEIYLLCSDVIISLVLISLLERAHKIFRGPTSLSGFLFAGQISFPHL